MSSNYAEHAGRKRVVSQSEQADARQIANSAGGFSFAVDDWTRLERFLILGTEGGSYYASEKKLTRENAAIVDRCLSADGLRAVELIASISEAGRAPKNDPAIFALSLAASHKDVAVRRAAFAAMPRVCRIGTHLFQFVSMLDSWGPAARRAFTRWYADRPADQLAYQLAKYQQRDGWSHGDVLRLAHVKTQSVEHNALIRWALKAGFEAREVKGKGDRKARSYPAVAAQLPRLIEGFEKVRESGLVSTQVAALVREYGLTHEMVPSQFLGHAEVWDALLQQMPMTAMVRNLARMTANGLLKPGSDASRLVVTKLRDADAIRKARLHPLAILLALRTYEAGRGDLGSLTWSPVKPIVDALDDAFYLGFDAIEPCGKPIMLALDVSGSMSVMLQTVRKGKTVQLPISAREASAVMAMVTARREPDYDLVGFAAPGSSKHVFGGMHGGGDPRLLPVRITAKTSLPDAIAEMAKIPMGGTDCSLPMRHALKNKQRCEGFVVYTDSETWAGPVHPHKALQQYRQQMGVPAKLVVVGMVSNGFTIADTSDAGMLDLVGFDTTAPALISDFIRGSRTHQRNAEEGEN